MPDRRNKKQHVRFSLYENELLIPELFQIGWERQTAARVALEPHIHKDAYEICYIVSGRLDWWAENEIYEVGAGDVYVTRPNERHGGVDAAMHPSELYWCVIDRAQLMKLPGITKEQRAELARDLSSLRKRHFAGSERIARSFEKLVSEHRDPQPHSPIICRAALYELLVETIRCERSGKKNTLITEPIQKSMQWMLRNLTEDFQMQDAADQAELTVNHFQNRFRKEVGLPPAEWRTRQKVRNAKHLLSDTERSVTSIAMQLGYHSSQYFATVFRKTTGLSPSRYRELLQSRER